MLTLIWVLTFTDQSIIASDRVLSGLSNPSKHLVFDHLQSDRIQSLIGGYQMWLDNFVIGGGLGAYIETQTLKSLVIHNTPLWILAEMGILGLMLSSYLPFQIIMHRIRNGIQTMKWEDSALLLILLSFMVFSQFHEIVYQRMFWFFLGLLAVRGKVFSNNSP